MAARSGSKMAMDASGLLAFGKIARNPGKQITGITIAEIQLDIHVQTGVVLDDEVGRVDSTMKTLDLRVEIIIPPPKCP